MARSCSPLIFTATRRVPELVAPVEPTPRELKPLSDIDDQETLRLHVPFVQIYPARQVENNDDDDDPVKVIRKALGKALVHYYPWAGRLREVGDSRKLVVDCTGEGVVFVEAEADVRLVDLAPHLHKSFPCFKELFSDDHIPGTCHILNCPLLSIQVTRLRCGGFVLASRINHTMTDALGLVMLLSAMSEIARGAPHPLVLPVWRREILCSRNPPHVTFLHHEYKLEVADTINHLYNDEKMIHKCFFFRPSELSTLRQHLQSHLRNCSTFELLVAFLWRCRTIALRLDPHKEVRLVCIASARFKLNPPIPTGYYGNTIGFPVAISTAGKICTNGVHYTLDLVKKAKAKVTEEYIHSVADLAAVQGRPLPSVLVGSAWTITDHTRFGYDKIDFGWGKPVYGGPAAGLIRVDGSDRISFLIRAQNGEGESGVLFPICLPSIAMERFAREVKIITEGCSKI